MALVKFMRSIAGRLLRVIAGLAVIWLALSQMMRPWSLIATAVGVVPILARLMNFCLLGPLFHADLWGRPKGAVVPE